MKVAIAGGGIIGLSIALELRGAGIDVVVFDKHPHGTQTSIAAGGMLAPQKEAHAPGPFLDLCLRSRTLWPAFAAKVAKLSGQPSTYLESGLLTAAFTDDECHSLDATAAWQRACSLRVDVLSGDEARRLEPLLSSRALMATFFPDDHQVDPKFFVPSLVEACRKSGVQLQVSPVTDLASVEADAVVIAAGAWSSQIPGSPVTLEPVRGQMIELHSDALPSKILVGPGCYLIPRADGRAIAGTTEEHAGFEVATTPEGVAAITAAVRTLCPALADVPVARSWAGLRPHAAQGLPVIGPGPRKNLVLATGHFRNGVLLAPVTARLVSQLIQGQRTSVNLKPFRFDRPSS